MTFISVGLVTAACTVPPPEASEINEDELASAVAQALDKYFKENPILVDVTIEVPDSGSSPSSDTVGQPGEDAGPVDPDVEPSTGDGGGVSPVEDAAADPPDTEDPKEDTGTPGILVDPLELDLTFEQSPLSGMVTVQPQVIGGGAIYGVEFFVDNIPEFTDFIPPYTLVLNTAQWADGPHTIAVYTADQSGQTASATVDVTFDNTPPSFSVTIPAEGEALFFEDGPLHLEVDTDDVNPLAEVQFYVNGELKAEFTQPPYTLDVEWEEVYVNLEDLPTTLYVQFYAKDQLGLETNKTYDVEVHRRFAWEYSTVGEIWAAPTLLPDGDLAFGNFNNRIYAVNQNGEETWSGPATLSGPINEPPVYDPSSGRIIVATLGGLLYSINPDNGGIHTSQDMGAPAGGDIRVFNGKIYFAGYDGYLHVLNTSNFSTDWSHLLPAELSTGPAVAADGTVYVGALDHFLYAVNSGGQVWAKETGNEVWGNPVIGPQGGIFFGSNDGYLYAVNPDGGDKWEQPTELNGQLWGQPLIGQDGHLYVISTSKYVSKVDFTDGHEIWGVKTQGLTTSGPIQGDDGTLYVGTSAGTVFALEPENGEILWTHQLSTAEEPHIHASPLVVGKKLYISCKDRSLYGLNLAPPSP